jgi:hypothetical protein
MRVFYRNHLGKRMDLSKPPYSLLYGELFDYTHEYETVSGGYYGEYISRFYKVVTKIPLQFSVLSKAENFNRALRAFYEFIDVDIETKTPGRIELDTGEYMEGYIVASKKGFDKRLMPAVSNDLTFVTERPFWCRDLHYQFEVGPDPSLPDPGGDDWLDFYDDKGRKGNFDYPFDFKRGTGVQTLKSNGLAGGKGYEFEMTIYGVPGAPTTPSITIGGHPYIVREIVYPAEKMIINSKEKRVYKVLDTGEEVSCFAKRNKEYSVFKPIEDGAWVVTTNSLFDLTVFQERSEPKWNL